MFHQKALFVFVAILLWALCTCGLLATTSPVPLEVAYPDGDYPSELYNFLALLIGFFSLIGFFFILPVASIWYQIKFHAAA